MKRRLAFFLIGFGACAWAAAAAPATSPATQTQGAAGLLGSRNANQPINVTADAFTGDLNTRVGTYSGNVIVTQGDMKMRADRVQVNVEAGKPSRIVASGNIVVTSQSGTATGDTGVYDVGPRLITLTGNVVLTKDKNVMRGTSLQVNLVTGQARLEAKGSAGGRVQGLFMPQHLTGQGGGTNTNKPNGNKPK